VGNAAETLTFEEIVSNPVAFIQSYFLVRTKEQAIRPMLLNDMQKHYMAHRSSRGSLYRGGRDIIVKARQIGMSTILLAYYLWNTITNEGTNTLIVGHDGTAMERMLEAAKLMLRGLPPDMRPHVKYDNRGELFFDRLGSRMWIGTYRSRTARSGTTHNLMLTEVAFWDARNIDELIAGFTESVPMSGNIAVESTTNGVGGIFWKMCEAYCAGDSAYRLHRYPWFCDRTYAIPKDQWADMPPAVRPGRALSGGRIELDPEERRLRKDYGLSNEQLMWRRWKMFELGDMSYPKIAVEGGKKPSRRSRKFEGEYSTEFLHAGHTVFNPDLIVPSTAWRKPDLTHRHVHGADTSLGVPGGAYSVLETLDADTGEFIHQIRGRWKPDEFAERMHPWLMECGGLVGIECNETGHAVLVRLAQLWRQAAGEIGQENMPYRIYCERHNLGFRTNERTRKVAVMDFDKDITEDGLHLAADDTEGLKELRQWEYNERMKETHPAGGYDDTVLAKLIARQMLKWYTACMSGRQTRGSVRAMTF